jgi:hypothetical protein
MELEGRVFKSGKFWLAEIPGLDYLTQGHSLKEALEMARDIVQTGIDKKNVVVKVTPLSKESFIVTASDSRAMIAHMLKRLRQKHGLTVREVSKRMGSSSPNAFGSYEQGRVAPTLDKLEELIHAIDPTHSIVLKIA